MVVVCDHAGRCDYNSRHWRGAPRRLSSRLFRRTEEKLSTMISESQENKPESILRVDNLGIDYASDFGRIHALRNVSLEVAPGEILGVVGESGSGKTTLALAVSRLLKMPPAIRTKGRVSFENTNVLLSSERKIDKLRGTGIFMIFQDPFMSLNPLMTVGDQLLEAIRIRCR